MTEPKIAEIAAKCCEAERQALLLRAGSHAVVTSPNVEPLWTVITKQSPGHFSITLNSTGQSVAAYLKEQSRV